MPKPTDQLRAPTPLTLLLHSQMTEHGWELRDVCRPPHGIRKGAPARSTMSRFLSDGYWLKQMPRPETREALAKAIRVNASEIDDAAWRSLESNRGRGLTAPNEPLEDDEIVIRIRAKGATPRAIQAAHRAAEAAAKSVLLELSRVGD